MICLDTNAVIAAIRGGATRFATRYDRELPKGALAVSSIVLFEMRYGISKSARVREDEHVSPSSSSLVSRFWISKREMPWKPAGSAPRWNWPARRSVPTMSSSPRRPGAAAPGLVTAQTREFARVHGLVLQDWSVP